MQNTADLSLESAPLTASVRTVGAQSTSARLATNAFSFAIPLAPSRGHLLVHGGRVSFARLRMAVRNPFSARLQGNGTARDSGGIFRDFGADLYRSLLPVSY